jgi:Spy/CpxP family protein refolding chaperone
MTDKRKAVLLVIVLFVLGISLGSVGAHMWDAHVIADHGHHRASDELKEELQLSPDQAKQFDQIMTDWRGKFHALDGQEHLEWDPKYDAIRHEERNNIRTILTPDQKVKFDAFLKRIDEERQKQQQQQQGH